MNTLLGALFVCACVSIALRPITDELSYRYNMWKWNRDK